MDFQFLLLFSFLVPFYYSSAQPLLDYCPPTANYISGSQFEINLNQLLTSLVTNGTLNNGFYTTTAGRNSNQVYGLVQCRGDISPEECSSCLSTSRSGISQICPNGKTAAIRYDNCLLRYSDQSFFTVPSTDLSVCRFSSQSVSDPTLFDQVRGELLSNLSSQAAFDGSGLRFGTGESRFSNSQNIYGLVQCTRDLSRGDCYSCLKYAIKKIPDCIGRNAGGQFLLVSCNIRYESYPFFASTQPTPPPSPPPLPPIAASSPPPTRASSPPPPPTRNSTDRIAPFPGQYESHCEAFSTNRKRVSFP